MDPSVRPNNKSLFCSRYSETPPQYELEPDKHMQTADLQDHLVPHHEPVAPGGSCHASTTEDGGTISPAVTLTSQVLHHHDLEQHNLHRDPTHLRITQSHLAQRLHVAARDLGIDGSIQDSITRNAFSMTPYERFEASLDYHLVAGSHQQHFVTANETYPSRQSHESSRSHQFSSSGSKSSIANHNHNHKSVVWYESSGTAPREGDPASWGCDLAGVGTQFDDVAQPPDTVTESIIGEGAS